MTAEETRYIEEHGEQIREYIQKQMHDMFAKTDKIPYNETASYVVEYVPRRKHKKRRIQKKWLKKYGIRVVKVTPRKTECWRMKIEPPKFIEPDDSCFSAKALYGTPVLNQGLVVRPIDIVE